MGFTRLTTMVKRAPRCFYLVCCIRTLWAVWSLFGHRTTLFQCCINVGPEWSEFGGFGVNEICYPCGWKYRRTCALIWLDKPSLTLPTRFSQRTAYLPTLLILQCRLQIDWWVEVLPPAMHASVWDALVENIRWAVCGSFSWRPTRQVTNDMKITHRCAMSKDVVLDIFRVMRIIDSFSPT